MPKDMQDAVAQRPLTVEIMNLGEPDDQLLWLDFDPDDVGVDEAMGTLRHTLSSAGFTSIMFGFRFSAHTGRRTADRRGGAAWPSHVSVLRFR
jgi:hypothetical protein